MLKLQFIKVLKNSDTIIFFEKVFDFRIDYLTWFCARVLASKLPRILYFNVILVILCLLQHILIIDNFINCYILITLLIIFLLSFILSFWPLWFYTLEVAHFRRNYLNYTIFVSLWTSIREQAPITVWILIYNFVEFDYLMTRRLLFKFKHLRIVYLSTRLLILNRLHVVLILDSTTLFFWKPHQLWVLIWAIPLNKHVLVLSQIEVIFRDRSTK